MSSAEAFPLPRAELVALFLEALLFGAFAVLYGISIWILLYRQQHHSRSRVRVWMFVTATAMFIFALAHLCIDLQRATQGFVVHGGTPRGTAEFYGNLGSTTHIAKSAFYIAQTLVGDGFVSYRLFIVYNRNPLILILPIPLLIGTLAAGCGICVVLTQIQGSGPIFSGNLVPWITSYFSLSLTTNVVATILIAARIMISNYRVQKYRAGYAAVTYQSVVETIVQSAAIYSLSLITLLATYLSDSNSQYICLDAIQPIIGIVFTLIIIRVGLNETTSEHSRGQGHIVDSRLSAAVPALPNGGSTAYPLRSLAINVSVSKTHDRSSFEGFERKDGATTKDSDAESGHGGAM